MRKRTFLLTLAVLLTAGCAGRDASISSAQNKRLAKASAGSVLSVAGETITCDEITEPLIEPLRSIARTSNLQRFKELVRPELEKVLADRIAYVLLYQQVKKDLGEKTDEALEKAAERQVRQLVVNEFAGDYTRAEQTLKQEGMDWDSFKESQKKLILIASQLPRPRPITHSQLLHCYNEMKDEFFVIPATIKFQLIDIELAKLRVAEPNRSRLELARELADNLIGRIRMGEDFRALAAEYPGVSFIRFNDPVQPESLARPYDILAAEAEKTQPGDIIGPIETEGKDHIFIMKLEEKLAEGFKPLKDVQRQVEEKIILDRRKQAADELDAKLAQQVALGERHKFIDSCLEKIYQRSNQ